MKLLGTWTLAGALLLTLLSVPARAQSCTRGCTQDETDCKAICKKRAGKVLAKCNAACSTEKEACIEECKTGSYPPIKGDDKDDAKDNGQSH
jgi:hypothetical protein